MKTKAEITIAKRERFNRIAALIKANPKKSGSEIAKLAKVGKSDVYRVWSSMQKVRIVEVLK